jgi:hypothetical protein
VHVAVAGQTLPHVPQFCSSVSRSTQAVPHTDWADGHSQLPEAQVAPVAHWKPHVPQFCSSVARFTQAVPQVWGSAAGQVQLRVAHTSFVLVQAFPHAPQSFASFARFTHLVGVPAGHVSGSDTGHWHAPATHTSFVSGQAFPHAVTSVPQFAGSFWTSLQRGFAPGQETHPSH